MKLHLQRQDFNPKATIGELFIDGSHECWTLEDVPRKVKVPGQTCIPEGSYEVIINFSNRFQRPLPLLLSVPGFEGIRIHPGNTDVDTDGCILVGVEKLNPDFIGRSREAFSLLFIKIQNAIQHGKVFITIDKS